VVFIHPLTRSAARAFNQGTSEPTPTKQMPPTSSALAGPMKSEQMAQMMPRTVKRILADIPL
jgi:hypothetical protein